jgi:hypothetical protein
MWRALVSSVFSDCGNAQSAGSLACCTARFDLTTTKTRSDNCSSHAEVSTDVMENDVPYFDISLLWRTSSERDELASGKLSKRRDVSRGLAPTFVRDGIGFWLAACAGITGLTWSLSITFGALNIAVRISSVVKNMVKRLVVLLWRVYVSVRQRLVFKQRRRRSSEWQVRKGFKAWVQR